jgi:hypothetical protein
MLERVEEVRRKTVGERIVDHLRSVPKVDAFTSRDVWPRATTQGGIAEAIGISRAHVALELKRLEAKGQVVRMLAHVERAPRRYAVYRPGNGTVLDVSDRDGRVLHYAVATVRTMPFATFRCPSCAATVHVALEN